MSHYRTFYSFGIFSLLTLFAGVNTANAVEASFTLEDGIRVIEDDGSTEFRFGGRLHLDWIQVNDDVTNFNDSVKIRRLRPYVRIRHRDWTLQVAGDIESEISGTKDLWLQKEFGPRVAVRVGNMVPPFGMESVSSSNYNTFADRALGHLFTAGFGLGGKITYVGDNWTIGGGWYSQPIDSLSNERERHGDGFVSRATFDPYRSGANLIHFGASLEIRDIPVDGLFRLRTKPETHSTNIRLVDTRTIEDASSFRNYGLEAATRVGSFSLQTEYMHSNVHRKNPGMMNMPSLNFDSFYAQASYILTGERRLYRAAEGVFTGVEPESDLGAIEIAIRYSTVDLTNKDITGGFERNWTVGLNWYLSRKTRFMFNFIDVDANPNRDGIRETPNIMVVRYQTFF